MEKKNLLFVAAAMVMAGCANDDMIGDNAATQSDNQVIGFNMNMPAMTRADMSRDASASALDNEFIVWGEKDEPTDGTACASTNLVFKNYRVHYADATGNTAGTTASNTTGWEYVGITPYHGDGTGSTTAGDGTEATAHVYPSMYTANTPKQTIKYWDLNTTGGYTFTAVSAKQQDIKDGYVTITKIESATSNASPKEKGYTIELKNGAHASDIFVAERQEGVKRTEPSAGTTVAAVQMKFRRFQTKIRFGFYETVPGYNVQITGVKYGANTSSAVKNHFGVDGKFVQVPTGTSSTDKLTYTITYDSKNIPVVTITTTSTATEDYAEFGNKVFDTNIGKTSDDATFDLENDDYNTILPNTGNDTDMSFIVSYKLISEDTGEEIVVTDRQVTVPAAYCMWKPNFAYTYLFKVSDQSAKLYPITFDAIVADDEINNQKTITEVSGDTENVSITTLGIGTDGKFYTDADEYTAGSTIYASIMTGTTPAVVDETTLKNKAKLYTVTASTVDNYQGTPVAPTITEASVANCIKNSKSGVADLNGGILTVSPVNSGVTYETTVPAEDGGTARTLAAMKWVDNNTNSANGDYYYAVEYVKDDTHKYYKIVKVVKK